MRTAAASAQPRHTPSLKVKPMSNPAPSLKIGTPSRAWRSRADAWEFLGYALRQLASTRQQESGLRPQIDRTFALLEAVEPYWAEPGVTAVAQLRQLIDDGEPQAAFQLLGGLANLPLASSGETAAVPRGETVDDEAVEQAEPAERPRFEVLVVDTIEPDEAEALKNTMAAQRRPSMLSPIPSTWFPATRMPWWPSC